SHDRDAGEISLNLASGIAGRHTAADEQLFDVLACIIGNCFQYGPNLITEGLEESADNMAAMCAQSQSQKGAAGLRIVVGGIEAGECGYEENLTAVGYGRGQTIQFMIFVKKLQLLLHPADSGTNDGGWRFQTVGLPMSGVPGTEDVDDLLPRRFLTHKYFHIGGRALRTFGR